jgi:hypothetical protein
MDMFKERRLVKGDRFVLIHHATDLLPLNMHPSETIADGKDSVCNDPRWPAVDFLRESRWRKKMTSGRNTVNIDWEEKLVTLKQELAQIQSDLREMRSGLRKKGMDEIHIYEDTAWAVYMQQGKPRRILTGSYFEQEESASLWEALSTFANFEPVPGKTRNFQAQIVIS